MKSRNFLDCGTLGRRVGDIRRICFPAEAAIVRENLQYLGLAQTWKDGETEELVRETFRAFGIFLVEFIHSLTLSPQEIVRRWRINGREHLEEFRSCPKGWILACVHTGNWEQLGTLSPLLGRRFVVPTGTQFHPLVSRIVKRIKRARGVASTPVRRNPRGLLRALDRGDVVVLPIDGGSFHRGIEVCLCGRPVRLAGGAAQLSLLSGRPILPVFSRRTGFMEQLIDMHAPLRPSDAGSARIYRQPSSREHEGACDGEEYVMSDRRSTCGYAEAARKITQQLADLLGAHLSATRGQWCIFRSIVPKKGSWTHPSATTASGRALAKAAWTK
ncbi:MAG: lysophospholipid acyltransferase family protein [Candidatus Eisenbacteria sp.]|nr:lysophospholipid acyltransferase family protein [Candidatus Eisenbacteria bacterium]